MGYLCAKFGNFSFSRFGFIVRADTDTDTHTHTHRITDAHHCYTHATTVGVSKHNESLHLQKLRYASFCNEAAVAGEIALS